MMDKAAEPLTAWANAQGAMFEFWLGSLQPAAATRQWHAWSRVGDTVGEAVAASTRAFLDTQVRAARLCAERIAADPRSSKLVVEGAHQAYDLVVAYTEASAATSDAWLAALRCADPARLASACATNTVPVEAGRDSDPVRPERP
jgi:hypothetical protein